MRGFLKHNIKHDYQNVFSSDAGKRVLRHLMKVGHVTTPVAHADSKRQDENIGMQRLVLSIMTHVFKTEEAKQRFTETAIEYPDNYES